MGDLLVYIYCFVVENNSSDKSRLVLLFIFFMYLVICVLSIVFIGVRFGCFFFVIRKFIVQFSFYIYNLLKIEMIFDFGVLVGF